MMAKIQENVKAKREIRANSIKHPMLLLNVPATLTFSGEAGQAPALVYKDIGRKKDTGSGTYHIKIYTPLSRMLFQSHPFRDSKTYTYESFVIGLLAHEISHILTGALDVEHVYDNNIYQEISNILDDSHDEYFMQRHYPVYASYINATLLGLKYASPVASGTDLRKDLNTLFHMVRFGHVPVDANPRFRDFTLPLIKSSVRGGRENVMDATLAVYEYLKAVHSETTAWAVGESSSGGVRITPMTGEELAKAVEQGVQMMNTDQLTALEQVKEGGKFPGVGEAEIVVKETDTDFFRNTVLKYDDTIALLRKAFMQKYDKPVEVRAYEGELLMGQDEQQRAYLDEVLGEESQVYTINEKQLLDIKVVTYRDVSSSTRNFSEQFAEAIIVFHAALQGLHGVQTANLDFSSGAHVSFKFGEEVSEAPISPECGGNTHLLPAIELVKNFDLTARRVLHFVITDGYISAPHRCQEELEQLGGKAWFIEIIPPGAISDGGYVKEFENSFSCTIEDLPFELMERLGE